MPNCDFYAVGDDFRSVLQFVFDELDCRVFETASAYDEEIMEFSSWESLSTARTVGQRKGAAESLYLQLWPVKASENVWIREIELDQKRVKNGRFRYSIEGWGLIQLYLGGKSELGLIHSHTNHNSEARARKWASTLDGMGSPSAWDWKIVSSTSSRLNRFIRKTAVSKVESRLVLPEAQELLRTGTKAL